MLAIVFLALGVWDAKADAASDFEDFHLGPSVGILYPGYSFLGVGLDALIASRLQLGIAGGVGFFDSVVSVNASYLIAVEGRLSPAVSSVALGVEWLVSCFELEKLCHETGPTVALVHDTSVFSTWPAQVSLAGSFHLSRPAPRLEGSTFFVPSVKFSVYFL
jgi:hypothetical protein